MSPSIIIPKFIEMINLRESRLSYNVKYFCILLSLILFCVLYHYLNSLLLNLIDPVIATLIGTTLSLGLGIPLILMVTLYTFIIFQRRINDIWTNKTKNERLIIGLTLFFTQVLVPFFGFIILLSLSFINSNFSESNFYVNNLDTVVSKYTNWVQNLFKK